MSDGLQADVLIANRAPNSLNGRKYAGKKEFGEQIHSRELHNSEFGANQGRTD
jgi:hypothetical protein